jgi:hypothetical protein
MTFIEVAQLDLAAMTKTELKNYAKKARAVWGEWIDLRKADVLALQQYLENYQAWAAKIAAIAEKMEETEAIEIPEIEADVTEFQDLPDFENGEPHITTLADFEGIDAPLGDWWMSCPLTCDPCNYQSCDLPPLQMQLPFVEEVMREGAKAMLESLEKRSEGAMDEALMQEYIDRSGLFEELEKAWHQIPDYKEFSEIFQQEAHIAMIMEILMTEEDHRRYVAVCKAAIAVEQQFARKALELLAR